MNRLSYVAKIEGNKRMFSAYANSAQAESFNPGSEIQEGILWSEAMNFPGPNTVVYGYCYNPDGKYAKKGERHGDDSHVGYARNESGNWVPITVQQGLGMSKLKKHYKESIIVRNPNLVFAKLHDVLRALESGEIEHVYEDFNRYEDAGITVLTNGVYE